MKIETGIELQEAIKKFLDSLEGDNRIDGFELVDDSMSWTIVVDLCGGLEATIIVES